MAKSAHVISYLKERRGLWHFKQSLLVREFLCEPTWRSASFLVIILRGKVYQTFFSERPEDLHNSSASMEREEMLIQHSVMAVSFVFTYTVEGSFLIFWDAFLRTGWLWR